MRIFDWEPTYRPRDVPPPAVRHAADAAPPADDSDVTIGQPRPVNAAPRLLLSVGRDEAGRAVFDASLVLTGVTFNSGGDQGSVLLVHVRGRARAVAALAPAWTS
jgi:hypothetical protein